MKNTQSTSKSQEPRIIAPNIRPQSFEELMAKGIRIRPESDLPDEHELKPRTPEQRAKYSVEAMLAEAEDAQTWWPDMSRAILEDARRSNYARRCAEDDLLHALKDAGLLKANVRRRDGEDIMESVWRVADALARAKAAKAARPKFSRAAMLYLERQKARS